MSPVFAGLVVARWLQFVSLALLLGSALFPFYAGEAATISGSRRLVSRAIATTVVTLVSLWAWALASLALVAGDVSSLAEPDVWSAFFLETSFGSVWILRLAIGAALLLAVAFGRECLFERNLPTALVAVLAAALLASQAWIGHPTSLPGAERWIAMAAYIAHVLGAGVWIGGLAPLGRVLAAAYRGGDAEKRAAELALRRFSPAGMIAVAAIFIGGLVNVAVRVNSLAALAASEWGRTLVVKLVLFAVMIAIAAVNRFYLMRRPARDECALVALRRNVFLEQVAGLLILAAAALLGVLAPAA